jgi:hypothetical protein
MDLTQVDQFLYAYSHYTPTDYNKIFILVIGFIIVILAILYLKSKAKNTVNPPNEQPN